MGTVTLGTIFDAERVSSNLVIIDRQELIKSGADGDYFSGKSLSFFLGEEVEIVED